jgi:hypothetical protein
LEPGFRQFEADARSVAANAQRDWYCGWIGTSRAVRSAVADAAARHHLDRETVLDVALVALCDAYRTERWKRTRKARQAAGGARAGRVEGLLTSPAE